MTTPNARHMKEQPNWETPQEYVDLCRTALGGNIDLDPFSCETGNARVHANRYFTEADDGSKQEWLGEKIFVNHPGGSTKRSWKKACEEFHAKHFSQMIWVGFSVEQLCLLSEPNAQTCTDEERYELGIYVPTDFSICFLRKRIPFIDPDRPERPSRPAHANYILGMGTNSALFQRTFADYGQTIHGDYVRR